MYSAAADRLKFPDGRAEIGSMQGTVAVSSAGAIVDTVKRLHAEILDDETCPLAHHECRP
jgi:hypothetical protein